MRTPLNLLLVLHLITNPAHALIRSAPPAVTVGSIEPDDSTAPVSVATTTPDPKDVVIELEPVKIPRFDDKGNLIK